MPPILQVDLPPTPVYPPPYPTSPQHVTMLVYLNSLTEEQQGHTTFPKLHVKVSPRGLSAVVFNDCLPNGEEDPRTLHGGSPPKSATKIAINIWIRADAYKKKSAGGSEPAGRGGSFFGL